MLLQSDHHAQTTRHWTYRIANSPTGLDLPCPGSLHQPLSTFWLLLSPPELAPPGGRSTQLEVSELCSLPDTLAYLCCSFYPRSLCYFLGAPGFRAAAWLNVNFGCNKSGAIPPGFVQFAFLVQLACYFHCIGIDLCDCVKQRIDLLDSVYVCLACSVPRLAGTDT